MTDPPGEHPLPTATLNSRNPLILTLSPGAILYRHHETAYSPIYYGKSGKYRFDDPTCPDPSSYGVLYIGHDPHCCFIESCVPTTCAPAVSGAYLADRAMATLQLTEELRFVDLATSGGLMRIGADGRLVNGSYKVAQQWSAALRLHPSKPDGICYPARHDPTRIAYAVFERAHSPFNIGSLGSLMSSSNKALLNQLLNDYCVDLL